MSSVLSTTKRLWLVSSLTAAVGCYEAVHMADSDDSTGPSGAGSAIEDEDGAMDSVDTGRPTDASATCLDGERRCFNDILQRCESAQWMDVEDCASMDLYCISEEDSDSCGSLCRTVDCGSLNMRCYPYYTTECGPHCLDLFLDIEELADTCTYNLYWDLIPGMMGVTKGCDLVQVKGEDNQGEVGMALSFEECEAAGGWFYAGAEGEQDSLWAWPLEECDLIELCPKTCDDIRSGELISLWLRFGCHWDLV